MSKISKAVFGALAKKIREDPDKLKNLQFPDASSSLTVIKTKDLRLDVHKNTKDPSMATGIVQANTEATDKTVKDFIKKKNKGPHKGTHKVIGEKIRFGLKENFDVEKVAEEIEQNS